MKLHILGQQADEIEALLGIRGPGQELAQRRRERRGIGADRSLHAVEPDFTNLVHHHEEHPGGALRHGRFGLLHTGRPRGRRLLCRVDRLRTVRRLAPIHVPVRRLAGWSLQDYGGTIPRPHRRKEVG